jgi:HrpA-like RNA helicase
MKIYSQEDYLDRLEKMYPEIERKSLKDILRIGNTKIFKRLKQHTRATYKFEGLDRIENTKVNLIIFKQNAVAYNNKYNYLKRREDERNGSK